VSRRRAGQLSVTLVAGLLATLGSLAGCATASGDRLAATESAATSWRYTLSSDAALTRLSVDVCFDGEAPPALVPGAFGGALPIAPTARVDGVRTSLAVGEAGALTLPARADLCVEYGLDIGALLAAGDRDQAFRVGRDVVVSPDLLLWRPRALPDSPRARLRFELPPGVAVSTPWPLVAAPAGTERTYVLDHTAFGWRGQIALGRFPVERLAIDAATTFDVAILDGPTRTTAAGRARWLRAAADGVKRMVGVFPRERLQVLIAPTARGSGDPVAFGYVLRGGGAGITLLLSSSAADGDLDEDWVAVHELFHLAMPPIVRSDAWLSEGVTMYFTELLRVRAGFIDVDAAFASLHAGFGRGRADGTGRPLAEESRLMHQTRAYRRVYWAGAAIALKADLALRADTGLGLDRVMAELRACCARSERFWSADEVVARMDALSGTSVYADTAARWLDAAAFPDLSAAYSELGLDPESGRPDRDPTHAALRHDVATGAAPGDREGPTRP